LADLDPFSPPEFIAELVGDLETGTPYSMTTVGIYTRDLSPEYFEDIHVITVDIDFPENYSASGPGPYIYAGYTETYVTTDASIDVDIIDVDPHPINFNYIARVHLTFGDEEIEFVDDWIPLLDVHFLLTGPAYCGESEFDLTYFVIQDWDELVFYPTQLDGCVVEDCE